jgi:hypothetical protein
MAKKPRKKGRPLPTTTQEWEALTSDEVMATIFGKDAQQTLKDQALTNDDKPKNDYRMPPE